MLGWATAYPPTWLVMIRWESFCLTSTETRLFIRDGDRRAGVGWGKEGKSDGSITGANPEDQGCRGPPPERQNC